ncbi:MAG: pore-forming ESAT-6 family protein [Erysipelotrichaceae bacterium]|nr:pore-forming ESAT-6 family protein [Erysipelotrichaceae bacterium]
MDTIQISLPEVSDTATKLRSINQMMYDDLVCMQKEMATLNGTWISEGGEEIRNRFQLFANRFEKHKALIDAYAKFLDTTVSSYDSLESTITGNATGIQY